MRYAWVIPKTWALGLVAIFAFGSAVTAEQVYDGSIFDDVIMTFRDTSSELTTTTTYTAAAGEQTSSLAAVLPGMMEDVRSNSEVAGETFVQGLTVDAIASVDNPPATTAHSSVENVGFLTGYGDITSAPAYSISQLGSATSPLVSTPAFVVFGLIVMAVALSFATSLWSIGNDLTSRAGTQPRVTAWRRALRSHVGIGDARLQRSISTSPVQRHSFVILGG